MIEFVLDCLVRTSVQVALLVVAILVVQRVAGRWLTPRWRYGLWLLVVLRLAIPVGFELPGGGIDKTVAEWCLAPSGTGERDPARARLTRDAGFIQMPVSSPRRSKDSESERAAKKHDEVTAVPARGVVASSRRTSTHRREPVAPIDWQSVALGGWAIVAIALVVLALARTLWFHRGVRRSVRVREGRALEILQECAARIGVGSDPVLVECPFVDNPAITGLRRAVVLMPPGLADTLDDAELRHVFLHELAHHKRRDVLSGVFVHLLACAYWFHPLVWFALHRLRATREVARDQEAIHADPQRDPLSYARTILKLCEGRPARSVPVPAIGLGLARTRVRDMQRRILMITQYGKFARSAPLIGGAALVGLVWLGFTDEAVDATRTSLSQKPDGQLAKIEVERHMEPPAWYTKLERALDRPMTLSIDEMPASEAVDVLRRTTGLNFVVDRDQIESVSDPDVSLTVEDTPLSEVLELLCDQVDGARYCIAREAFYLGGEDMPAVTELRFYKIGPFIGPNEDPGPVGDRIVDLVRTYASLRDTWTWDSDLASIEHWNGLLTVNQTRDMHRHVEAFLNRLLNRGKEPKKTPSKWRARVAETLRKVTSVRATDEEIGVLAKRLGKQHGVGILVDEDFSFEPVSVQLDEVTLGAALDWIASQHELRVTTDKGVLRIGQRRPTPRLEFFEMGALYRTSRFADRGDVQSYVEDLIRNRIEPDAWDDQYSIVFWKDLALVSADASVHGQIRSLLAALERAFRG